MSSFMGVLLTSASTLVAVLLTLIFTNRREQKRQEHERELKRMEFEHQAKQQAHEEKLKIYSRLHSMTVTIDPAKDAPLKEIAEIVSQVEFSAESETVLNAVHRMYSQCYTLDKVGREIRQKQRNPENDTGYVEAFKKFGQERNSFFRSAKRDLGLYAGEEYEENSKI